MRDEFSICDLCEAFGVSRSGYYKWRQAPKSQRALQNARLLSCIREVHADAHLRCYGSPRMTHELRDRGIACSENRVARVMRTHQIQGRRKRAFRPRTTTRGSAKASPNLLKHSKPTAPGQVLVSDITYVATREGWLYLAVVMDLFTRLITGWAIRESLHADLVLDALDRNHSRPSSSRPPVLFHSDRGCQYSSSAFRSRLRLLRMRQSMSARGYCYDNAACESFFATIKTEAFPQDGVFESQQQARLAIFEYLETFYNPRRKHSALGYLSPRQFLQNHFQSKPNHLS